MSFKFAVSLLLVAILYVAHVNSQCIFLVDGYNKCNAAAVDPNSINSINETFYAQNLSQFNTFDKAMDYFVQIYKADADCFIPSASCNCYKTNNIVNSVPPYKYSSFFLNTSYFSSVKKLVGSVINKTYQARTQIEVNADASTQYGFVYFNQTGSMSLNTFCQKYEYFKIMELFYNEVKSCSAQANTTDTAVISKCNVTYGYNITDNLKIENYLKCLYSFRNCAKDIKNFLALADVAKDPQIIQGDLYDYVQYLTYVPSSASQIWNAKSTFIFPTLWILLITLFH